MSFLTDTEFRGEGPGMCVWGGMTIGSWVVSQELLESAYDMHSGLWCILQLAMTLSCCLTTASEGQDFNAHKLRFWYCNGDRCMK